METVITAFDNAAHRNQVVRLWEHVFGYVAPHNAPSLIIDKKLEVTDDLFFVAVAGGVVVGTIMAGYDGHRGWIYSMAVHPDHQGRSIGTRLLVFVEKRLASLGCMKINLQIDVLFIDLVAETENRIAHDVRHDGRFQVQGDWFYALVYHLREIIQQQPRSLRTRLQRLPRSVLGNLL